MKSDMAGQRGREGYFVRMSGWEIKGRWGAHVGLKNQTTFFFFFFKENWARALQQHINLFTTTTLNLKK